MPRKEQPVEVVAFMDHLLVDFRRYSNTQTSENSHASSDTNRISMLISRVVTIPFGTVSLIAVQLNGTQGAYGDGGLTSNNIQDCI